jgi:hypothetical protein
MMQLAVFADADAAADANTNADTNTNGGVGAEVVRPPCRLVWGSLGHWVFFSRSFADPGEISTISPELGVLNGLNTSVLLSSLLLSHPSILHQLSFSATLAI